jgi:predicted CopG family antitoxin
MAQNIFKQIKIREETYDGLKGIGKMGDSFDAVITKILEHYKRTAKR